MRNLYIDGLSNHGRPKIFRKCSMCSSDLGDNYQHIVTDNANHVYKESVPDIIIRAISIDIPNEVSFEYTVLCVEARDYGTYMSTNMLNSAKVMSAVCPPCAHIIKMGIILGDVKEVPADPFGETKYYAWVPKYRIDDTTDADVYYNGTVYTTTSSSI